MSDLMRMFKQLTSTDPVGDLKKDIGDAATEAERQHIADCYADTATRKITNNGK